MIEAVKHRQKKKVDELKKKGVFTLEMSEEELKKFNEANAKKEESKSGKPAGTKPQGKEDTPKKGKK